jgi:hypothetical protein
MLLTFFFNDHLCLGLPGGLFLNGFPTVDTDTSITDSCKYS